MFQTYYGNMWNDLNEFNKDIVFKTTPKALWTILFIFWWIHIWLQNDLKIKCFLNTILHNSNANKNWVIKIQGSDFF
jgi:hypothetical protein